MTTRERAGAVAIGALLGGMCALAVCILEKIVLR